MTSQFDRMIAEPTTLAPLVRGNTRAHLVTDVSGPLAAERHHAAESGGTGCTVIRVTENHHPGFFTVEFVQHSGRGPALCSGTYRTDIIRARALLSLSSASSARTYIRANQR